MNQPMIITNVRIPQTEYRQMKAIASELGISVNHYIKRSLDFAYKNKQFFHGAQKRKRKFEAFWEILDKKTAGKPMGWSKEDEAIYSV